MKKAIAQTLKHSQHSKGLNLLGAPNLVFETQDALLSPQNMQNLSFPYLPAIKML